MRLKLTWWDIDRIKPWETFELTNADPKYTGRTFRVDSMEVDPLTDKVTAEVYEV